MKYALVRIIALVTDCFTIVAKFDDLEEAIQEKNAKQYPEDFIIIQIFE